MRAQSRQSAEGVNVDLYLTAEDLAVLARSEGGPLRVYVQPDEQGGDSSVVEVVIWANGQGTDGVAANG